MNNNKKKYGIVLCTNCGNKGHDWKSCTQAITSWGIILVKFNNLQLPTHDQYVNLQSSDDYMSDIKRRAMIKYKEDKMLVCAACYDINFLFISRKYSLGYVEFIRGRYRPEKADPTIYLFRQMMKHEIKDIKLSLSMDDGFEYLWTKFWGDEHNKSHRAKEKMESKSRYQMLKYVGVDGPEINLEYIVDNVEPEYSTEEWGFPKGRRNKYESDEECAIREFKEESGYLDEDFKIIREIEPLVENLTGTNGIEYRHVYYVAELITNKEPRNGITESQKNEVGNIKFMDIQTSNMFIRDYHIARRDIIHRIFTYYLDRLVFDNRAKIKALEKEEDNKIIITPKDRADKLNITNNKKQVIELGDN